jgi:hypothetical protein
MRNFLMWVAVSWALINQTSLMTWHLDLSLALFSFNITHPPLPPHLGLFGTPYCVWHTGSMFHSKFLLDHPVFMVLDSGLVPLMESWSYVSSPRSMYSTARTSSF